VLIEVPETPTSGYRWELLDTNEDVHVLENSFSDAGTDADALAGAVGLRRMLVAVPDGVSTIEIGLRRSWSSDLLERRLVYIEDE
jgi:predicted secreted protein